MEKNPPTKKKSRAMSREKGKRGEREVAALFRSHGFVARRGVQYQGGPGSPDVVTELPIHVEVKRTESLSLWPAMEQARNDAGWDETPTVWHRPSHRDWVVILDAGYFFDLLKQAFKKGER